MNFKNIFFALVLMGSAVACAHNHHNLTKEEVIIALIHAEKVNENLKAQIACLKSEIKHELSKEHRFHELVKALVQLEKAI